MASNFLEKFLNRKGGYGRYLPNKPGEKAKAYTEKESLSKDVLSAHLEGAIVIGCHSTSETVTSKWLCVDLDASKEAKEAFLKGERSALDDEKKNLLIRAIELMRKMEADGLLPMLEDSVGGYHIWAFFHSPQPTENVFAYLQTLNLEGLEGFPKQPKIGENGWGNWVRLPGRYHSTSEWTTIWKNEKWISMQNPQGGKWAVEQWPTSPLPLVEVKEIEKPKKQERPPPAGPKPAPAFDVRSFLAEKGITIQEEKPWNDCTMLVLGNCIFDPSHAGKDSSVLIHADGKLSYQCFHNSCQGRTWPEAREQLEGPREKKIVVCKNCGKECQWGKESSGKWRLFNNAGDSLPHVCVGKEKNPLSPSVVSPTAEPLDRIPEVTASSFPLDALPPILRKIAEEGSKAFYASPDFFCGHILAIAGAMIGNSRRLWIKPSHSEGATIFHCLVAPPGSKKSPILNFLLSPLHKIEQGKREAHKETKDRFLLEKERHKEQLKTAIKQGATELPEEPECPFQERVLSTNATVEALCSLLFENPKGILLHKDEMSGLISGMNQYKAGRGDDKEFFLSSWSNTPGTIDRVLEEKRKYVPTPFLGIAGNTTPDNLSMIRGAIQDGFIDRFLFTMPATNPSWYSEYEIPQAIVDDYASLIAWLQAAPFEKKGDEGYLRMSMSAWASYAIYHDRLEKQKQEEEKLAGVLAKYQSYVARIALVLATCENAAQVEDEVMQRAIRISLFFTEQARLVFSNLEISEEERHAMKIIAWMKKKGLTKATLRDICRSEVCGKRADLVKGNIGILVQAGYAHFNGDKVVEIA